MSFNSFILTLLSLTKLFEEETGETFSLNRLILYLQGQLHSSDTLSFTYKWLVLYSTLSFLCSSQKTWVNYNKCIFLGWKNTREKSTGDTPKKLQEK